MFAHWFSKTRPYSTSESENPQSEPLLYSWILTNRLAIGPMPKSGAHWQQLEDEGFKKRFSCCYPSEHVYSPIPFDWISKEVSLPDHRSQEELNSDTLILALNEALQLIESDSSPTYIHCFAGQERSALIAIGLICIIEKKNLFDSLAYVKMCHKKAKPLYSQLDLMERILPMIDNQAF